MGSCGERILQRLAVEAVIASQRDSAPAPASPDRYRDFLRSFLPSALEAIRASDDARTRLLTAWDDAVPPRDLEPVPALVRRGLFALAARLAREELRSYVRGSGGDAAALERELDSFVSAATAALAGRSIGVT
jgi:hypothetical protein